ncbi:MAG TPA: metallopeptidase family protein, partial [Patescibacteria group bacterium]|nr:metallopeptidase family protein [Patescibacteria group bacterium]
MVNLPDQEFEALIEEGVGAIPQEFRELMKNVAIVVADEPTPEQLIKTGLRPGVALFGLYEGVPQISRGAGYSGVLPDKITIFKQAILSACSTAAQVREQVKETVLHE